MLRDRILAISNRAFGLCLWTVCGLATNPRGIEHVLGRIIE